MKKLIVLSWFLPFCLMAQQKQVLEPITYKNFTSLPVFPLLDTDSNRIYTTKVMQLKKPGVIIYFSPTCNHCQHQVQEITSHYQKLKNVQFLLVSAYDLADIRRFSQAYGLSHFSNISLAKDPYGNLRKFMDLKRMPGILVFNNQSKLIAARFINLSTDSLLAFTHL